MTRYILLASLLLAVKSHALTCGALFSDLSPVSARIEARLDAQRTLGILNERELSVFRSLVSADVQPNALLRRFEALQRYATQDRMMTVAPTQLLKLAAASVKANWSVREVVASIHVMGAAVEPLSGINAKGRILLWTPSRVLLSLTEAALSSGRPVAEVAELFNRNVKEITSQDIDGISLLLAPPMELALLRTRSALGLLL